MPMLINSLNKYLQKRFGCRVYKISIDGGFSCPNRDGTKGVDGCIFCDERGSSSRVQEETLQDEYLDEVILTSESPNLPNDHSAGRVAEYWADRPGIGPSALLAAYVSDCRMQSATHQSPATPPVY